MFIFVLFLFFLQKQESFEQFGKVERVKKIKDYAFIHFEDRDHAVLAMKELDGKELGGSNLEVCVSFFNTVRWSWESNRFLSTQVSLAKPPSDKKKKEEILRARERRMNQFLQSRMGIVG